MGRGKRIAGAVSVFVRQPHLRRRREKAAGLPDNAASDPVSGVAGRLGAVVVWISVENDGVVLGLLRTELAGIHRRPGIAPAGQQHRQISPMLRVGRRAPVAPGLAEGVGAQRLAAAALVDMHGEKAPCRQAPDLGDYNGSPGGGVEENLAPNGFITRRAG